MKSGRQVAATRQPSASSRKHEKIMSIHRLIFNTSEPVSSKDRPYPYATRTILQPRGSETLGLFVRSTYRPDMIIKHSRRIPFRSIHSCCSRRLFVLSGKPHILHLNNGLRPHQPLQSVGEPSAEKRDQGRRLRLVWAVWPAIGLDRHFHSGRPKA